MTTHSNTLAHMMNTAIQIRPVTSTKVNTVIPTTPADTDRVSVSVGDPEQGKQVMSRHAGGDNDVLYLQCE